MPTYDFRCSTPGCESTAESSQREPRPPCPAHGPMQRRYNPPALTQAATPSRGARTA